VVSVDSNGAYSVAAIDFAYSVAWQEPDGGPVQPPNVPPSLAGNVDQNVVAAATTAIEAVSDDTIRNVVDSLPRELVSDDEKKRLATGLISRREKIREVMKNQGWLP